MPKVSTPTAEPAVEAPQEDFFPKGDPFAASLSDAPPEAPAAAPEPPQDKPQAAKAAPKPPEPETAPAEAAVTEEPAPGQALEPMTLVGEIVEPEAIGAEELAAAKLEIALARERLALHQETMAQREVMQAGCLKEVKDPYHWLKFGEDAMIWGIGVDKAMKWFHVAIFHFERKADGDLIRDENGRPMRFPGFVESPPETDPSGGTRYRVQAYAISPYGDGLPHAIEGECTTQHALAKQRQKEGSSISPHAQARFHARSMAYRWALRRTVGFGSGSIAELQKLFGNPSWRPGKDSTR